MPYHIDAENVNLADLRKRIEATDLVPSRVSLLNEIATKMKALEKHDITTLARLRYELKTSKRLEAVASATGIESQYLVLLRREIEGYFPKPCALKEFEWLPEDEIVKLEENGFTHAAALYDAISQSGSKAELMAKTNVDGAVLDTLLALVDLTRVQWVSPTAARMLVEASIESAASLAAADADELYLALVRVNQGDRFFKGKIGLRDVRRLIRSAGYVPA